MAHWYIRPRATCLPWAANTAYSAGDRCVCTRAYATVARRRYVYECTIAGTSHAATQPAWPTSGTIADGGVTWTTRSPTTWANATIFLDYIMSLTSNVWTAGDTFWIDSTAVITITDGLLAIGEGTYNPGNAKIPTRIISTDDLDTEPPVTYAPGATLKSIANVELRSNGLHLWGLDLHAGTGASSGTPSIYAANLDTYATGNLSRFHDCNLFLDYAVANCSFRTGNGAQNYGPADTTLRNTTVTFTHAGQYLRLGIGYTDWLGGAILGTPPTNLFAGAGPAQMCAARIEAVDLDLETGNLFWAPNFGTAPIHVTRCLLNSAVALHGGTPPTLGALPFIIEDCYVDAPPTRATSASYLATLTPETTFVRDGGFEHLGAPTSWKVVTTAENNAGGFSAPEVLLANDITDTELNARVQILIDSATPLTTADVWIELSSLDTADSPLATLHTTQPTPPFTGVALEQSDLTWDTTGMANPQPCALVATFTPGQPGEIAARVVIAKPSATIYIDPVLTLYLGDDPAPQPDPIPDFPFIMTTAADGITPMAGLTITATVSIDGADFVAAANSPTEVANGLYKIALADEDLAGDWIILRLTADDAVTQHITLQP